MCGVSVEQGVAGGGPTWSAGTRGAGTPVGLTWADVVAPPAVSGGGGEERGRRR